MFLGYVERCAVLLHLIDGNSAIRWAITGRIIDDLSNMGRPGGQAARTRC